MNKTEQQLYAEIGLSIRTTRELLHVTQAQLADRLPILRSSLANIEAGRQRISLMQIENIALALGVSPALLLPDRWNLADERQLKRAALKEQIRKLKKEQSYLEMRLKEVEL